VVPLDFEARSFVLLVPPLAVETAAVYRAWDQLPETRQHSTGEEGENDLTAAALEVVPELARWRDRLGELTGRFPRLAGSGATWFVQGTEAELGLGGVSRVELVGGAGRLIPVRTIGPAIGSGGAGRPAG
jgi:4-diphosphocytidyl-2-C-methyl-D-erythritol kinase